MTQYVKAATSWKSLWTIAFKVLKRPGYCNKCLLCTKALWVWAFRGPYLSHSTAALDTRKVGGEWKRGLLSCGTLPAKFPSHQTFAWHHHHIPFDHRGIQILWWVFRILCSADCAVCVQASQSEVHYNTSYREPSVIEIGSISTKAMRTRHKVKTCGMQWVGCSQWKHRKHMEQFSKDWTGLWKNEAVVLRQANNCSEAAWEYESHRPIQLSFWLCHAVHKKEKPLQSSSKLSICSLPCLLLGENCHGSLRMLEIR